MQRAIDCAVQHIKVFREQALVGMVADLGEPCEKCDYVNDCDVQWFSILSPLLEQSNIKISMVVQEQIEPQDKTLFETEQDVGNQSYIGKKNE